MYNFADSSIRLNLVSVVGPINVNLDAGQNERPFSFSVQIGAAIICCKCKTREDAKNERNNLIDALIHG